VISWPHRLSGLVSSPARRVGIAAEAAFDSGGVALADELQGKRVAFLVANEGVEQIELTSPWGAVKEAGGEPVLVASKAGRVQGFNHLDRADEFPVDRVSSEVSVDDFDALVLPGGVANADQLRTDSSAVDLVARFFDTGRPIAVICHGPWAIVEADKVRNRTLTSWPSLQTDIRNAGGTWVDQEVKVCDEGPGLLVSSRKPDDLPAFNAALIGAFSGASSSTTRSTSSNGEVGAGGRYADPQDLQFGQAAREKEERLDQALARGEPVPPDEPPQERPRPGGKAEPKAR
jgi:protease I